MKTTGTLLLIWLAAAWNAPCSVLAQVPRESYRIENVRTPPGAAPEVGGIDFDADGRLVACFRRGGLYRRDPETGRWSRFATGLQVPLGIVAGKPGEYFVAQRSELTRVVDTDGDERADHYQTLSDRWGVSGNYHEYAYGLVRDGEGNFFVGLGLASGSSRHRFAGRGAATTRSWFAEKPRPGIVGRFRHNSPVSHRGWVIKITPAGSFVPVASGFRQPNGLGFNREGDLFVTDNQGGWIGTSPLHHVTPGSFYGHPASLNWHPDFQGINPVDIEVETLARRRKPPAVQIPQNDMAGSLAQPLEDRTRGRFGPYSGQMFIADWTYPRIHRVYLEKVGGTWQGACFPFIEGRGLRKGNIRLAFSPNGDLYVAQTSRIWGLGEGLQRVAWTGKTPMDIQEMRLTATGFDLVFTKPLDPATAARAGDYSVFHYYYRYHGEYGSPKTDVTPVRIEEVSISRDGRRVSLRLLDPLVPGRVYELRPGRRIRSQDGEPLVTRLAAYTVNRLREANE